MRILLTFIFQMVRFLLHNVFLFLKSVIYPPLLTQIKSFNYFGGWPKDLRSVPKKY